MWFNDSFQYTCSCAIFFHLQNQHNIFLSPSPSSCTVIKFTLSSIYLEINLIPREKRDCAFALYLPLSFIHLIALCHSLGLYQFKNPTKFLKKCPPQNVLFKRQNPVMFQVILCFSQSKENTSKNRISMMIKQTPTVFYPILCKKQVQPSWDGTLIPLHLGLGLELGVWDQMQTYYNGI